MTFCMFQMAVCFNSVSNHIKKDAESNLTRKKYIKKFLHFYEVAYFIGVEFKKFCFNR